MVDPPDSTSWKVDSGWMEVKRTRTRSGITKNIPEEGKTKERQRSNGSNLCRRRELKTARHCRIARLSRTVDDRDVLTDG